MSTKITKMNRLPYIKELNESNGDIKKVSQKEASTGTIYQIWTYKNIPFKVRYSDHPSNILHHDADLELDTEQLDTDIAKEQIEQFIIQKYNDTVWLEFGENHDILGYDIVERIGNQVYLKNKKIKKYHKNQIEGGMFTGRDSAKKRENWLKTAKRDGDYYYKEGYDIITLFAKEFYRRYPNVQFIRDKNL